METNANKSHYFPALSQIKHNSNSWIGHNHLEPLDMFAGQVFECPAEGELGVIQVYATAVQRPGKIKLTFHQFDEQKWSWGPVIANTETVIDSSDVSKWIRFYLPSLQLQKKNIYGFRLQSNEALIAVGEAVWSYQNAINFGREWTASTQDSEGHYYQYLSLAFKLEMRA